MRARRAGESALLLLDVVDVLNREGIDYVVIGALAATVHGVIRASADADLLLASTAQAASHLTALFIAAGLIAETRVGGLDDPIPALIPVSDAFGNRVDLLLGLRGIDSAAFTRAVAVDFQGARLKFIGREDFVAMKLFAGGPVDILDARRAILASQGNLDRELLFAMARRYGAATVKVLEDVLLENNS